MKLLTTVLLVLVGLINFAPVLAAVSAQRVESSYGVAIASADMEILLRHRAMLFGIVGALIIVSAFVTALRWPAIAAGLVSMLSFVMLALMVGGYGPALRRVVIADVVGLGMLAIAIAIEWTRTPA